MAPITRRALISSATIAGAAAEVSLLSAGCGGTGRPSEPEDREGVGGMNVNPYEFGAVGDGTYDDTPALQAAYDSALTQGGGTVLLTRGRFFIPGHLEMEHPGVSFQGCGGAIVGGGEVRVGPSEYQTDAGGVDFSTDTIGGVVFDQADGYGNARCLVLRNVRGLDVAQNLFRSAGKGVSVEGVDGNETFHSTAMLRVSNNRFTKLSFGIYGDTAAWDTLSDWQITDNYFNYCSDTSVWIASSNESGTGGIDGLNFAGNTVFAKNHNSRDEPLFAKKRYNLCLGQSNWLRIVNNNFFEAGLSAVCLNKPQNFTFVGNHVAWPGQRELSDALEIHNGSPIGVVQGNTFAMWTRAAVGLYDLDDLTRVEIGQNAWNWSASPSSWTGEGRLPGYRIYASTGGSGYPIVRDFQSTGTYDELKGDTQRQCRDIKTPKGGVTGAYRRNLQVAEPVTVFQLSDITGAKSFGGLITITATSATDEALVATYLLFVSSQGSVCTVVESGGHTDGTAAEHPSFSWSLLDNRLGVSPIGSTNGTYNFDAVGIGTASPY